MMDLQMVKRTIWYMVIDAPNITGREIKERFDDNRIKLNGRPVASGLISTILVDARGFLRLLIDRKLTSIKLDNPIIPFARVREEPELSIRPVKPKHRHQRMDN